MSRLRGNAMLYFPQPRGYDWWGCHLIKRSSWRQLRFTSCGDATFQFDAQRSKQQCVAVFFRSSSLPSPKSAATSCDFRCTPPFPLPPAPDLRVPPSIREGIPGRSCQERSAEGVCVRVSFIGRSTSERAILRAGRPSARPRSVASAVPHRGRRLRAHVPRTAVPPQAIARELGVRAASS